MGPMGPMAPAEPAERACTMLDVDDLSVSYGAVKALRGVTFQAQDGSVTAVLGANGAGKTTLLRTVSGLVKQQSGTVSYDGVKLSGLSVENIVRLGISHVPEGRGVIEELTVDENLRLGTLWQFNRRQRKSVLDEIYELFPPLAERRSRMASTLSGGERQMLAIGRALSSKPKLLLLDEPSLGLAPLVTAQIMALVRRLARETRLTVVLVEQNVRSALSIAEEAVVINLGRVVVADRAETVAADTQLRHHYLGF
jgi:branched-chain amino acid transport system ATP-binding protein